MNIYFKKNRIDFLIIVIFLLLPFIFFRYGFAIADHILGSGDATGIAIPVRILVEKIFREGQFPFWNIFNFSGYPLIAYNEAGIFYPVNLILDFIFSPAVSYNLSVLFHYSMAGIFLYFFLREYNLNYYASFTAGLIFMFSGSMTAQRSHPWQLYTMVWLPLILLFLEKFRKSKRFEFVLIASIFYALSFFAGSPQIFLYSSMVILFYVLFYALVFEGIKNYRFLLSMLVFIFGMLVSLVQLIPSLELMRASARDTISYEYFSSFSFSPKNLILLFFPYFFGNPYHYLKGVPDYFGPPNYTETVIYFGIITVILFIFGFFVKNRHKYLWMFLLGFSLLLVFGSNTPLYRIMYHIPIYNSFRVSSRNWFEFGFAFSVLAGFGFNYLMEIDLKASREILKGLIVFFSIIFAGFFIFYYYFKANFGF